MEIHGTTGQKDERGLISITVPYLAESLEQCLTVGEAFVAGLPEVGRTFRADQGHTFIVDVTYEGSNISSSDKLGEETFEGKGSFREEPIEAHPKIENLISKFNGQRDPQTQKVTFPATLEGSSGTNALSGEQGVAEEKRNPMAGVEKYMELEVVWQRKYISKSIPRNLYLKVGRVIKRPPGNPPPVPRRDAWLVNPPQVSKRGNVVEITEEYVLLPEGTPAEIYNLGKPAEK